VSNAFIFSLSMQNGYNLDMNFRHLRTFVAIADAGGVARGSARLNLSQPAASRQIQALEAELDVALFDRIGRQVHLTSQGEDLLWRSRRLLQDADAIGQRARALKSGQTGILRVGATPQTIESLFAAVFLTAYRRRHPGVEVHLVEEGTIRLPDRLSHGDVHLALIPPDERFQCRAIYPICVLAVLCENHTLNRCRTLDVAELADEPVLLLHPSFGTRVWFDAACQVAHIRPRVLLESAAPHTIIALAREGYGVAVVPSTAVVPREGVIAVPLVQHGAAMGVWLTAAWDPQRFHTLYAEQFVEELVAHTRRDYPGRQFVRCAPSLPRLKKAAR
jgi:LysR family transcriptional regulator, cyn operon transcriptional activator